MLKMKLQHFGHLIWRADSFEMTLMLGRIEDRRRKGGQRMRWLNGITDYELDYSLNMNLSKLWGTVKDREAWHVAVCGVAKSRTWLSDWTTTAEIIILSEVSQTKTNAIWCHLHVKSKIWLKWTYLQNRNRLIDTENRLMVAKEAGRGINWEFGVDRCKLLHLEWINNQVLLWLAQRAVFNTPW